MTDVKFDKFRIDCFFSPGNKCGGCGCEIAPKTPAMFRRRVGDVTWLHADTLCGDCMPKDRVTPEMLSSFREALDNVVFA